MHEINVYTLFKAGARKARILVAGLGGIGGLGAMGRYHIAFCMILPHALQSIMA